jgi:hypothetical protein
MEIPIALLDGVIVAGAAAAASFIGSLAANKVTLKYMQRDIDRAQEAADHAHGRIDDILSDRDGWRTYGTTELPKNFKAS